MSQSGVEIVHWRDASRPVKFFIWDAEASYPFLLWFLFPSLWLLELAVCVAVFFTVLNRYGISLVVFLRIFRSYIAGRQKYARPWWVC